MSQRTAQLIGQLIGMMILLALLIALLFGKGWAQSLQERMITVDTSESAIRIDRASFDAMLKDYPEAKLRVVLTEDPCLVILREVMRAWDDHITALNQVGLHTIPGDLWSYTKWDEARKCWRDK